jgi:hypothetical protein
MKMAVFWSLGACNLVEFTDVSEVLAESVTYLVMDAASISETSVIF